MNGISYKIETAKDGMPVLIIIKDGREFPLHSRISPSKEGLSANYEINPEKFDLLIIIGCGLGYHLIPLKTEIRKYNKIIIIDANPDTKKNILKNSLTDFLAAEKNIIFISGLKSADIHEKIISLIDFNHIKGISLIEHPQSFRILNEYYSDVKSSINKIIDKKASDAASINAFGKLYLKNAMKNISLMKNYCSVKNLFDKFKNMPALIVASGPSLDSSISFLREIQNKIFIIAADSACGTLYKNSILPDFVISIDPQPYIEEHLRLIPDRVSAFIFSMTADTRSVKKHTGYISMTTHPVCQLIEEIEPGVSSGIDSLTGNVTGDALMFAVRAGFNNIGLMGLDFSFYDYSIYARGSAYQNRYSLFFQNRTLPVETANLNYIMKSSGGTIYEGKLTRKSFINYRNSFEDMIRKNGITGIYNINETGLDIQGTERISIEQYAEQFCIRNISKNEIISGIKEESSVLDNVINSYKKNITPALFSEILSASLGKNISDHVSGKFIKLAQGIK